MFLSQKTLTVEKTEPGSKANTAFWEGVGRVLMRLQSWDQTGLYLQQWQPAYSCSEPRQNMLPDKLINSIQSPNFPLLPAVRKLWACFCTLKLGCALRILRHSLSGIFLTAHIDCVLKTCTKYFPYQLNACSSPEKPLYCHCPQAHTAGKEVQRLQSLCPVPIPGYELFPMDWFPDTITTTFTTSS